MLAPEVMNCTAEVSRFRLLGLSTPSRWTRCVSITLLKKAEMADRRKIVT